MSRAELYLEMSRCLLSYLYIYYIFPIALIISLKRNGRHVKLLFGCLKKHPNYYPKPKTKEGANAQDFQDKCMYVCMYVCIYINIYIYICIYIYIDI